MRKQFAEELVKEYLPTYRFKVNHRLSRALGRCNYTTRTIEISGQLYERGNDRDFLNTLTHEIAHGLCGHRHGHNEVWRQKHIELGGDGKRCANALELSFTVERKKTKYVVKCGGGHPGREYKVKPVKMMKNIHKYYCRTCGVKSLGELRIETV